VNYKLRFKMKLLVIVVGLALLFALVAAQEPTEEWLPTSLADLILKLSTPSWIVGALAALLAVISQYGWKGYDNLQTKYKRAAFILMCMASPAIAVGLRVLSFGEALTWEMIMAGIQAGWAAFGLGTALHSVLPQKIKGNWLVRGY